MPTLRALLTALVLCTALPGAAPGLPHPVPGAGLPPDLEHPFPLKVTPPEPPPPPPAPAAPSSAGAGSLEGHVRVQVPLAVPAPPTLFPTPAGLPVTLIDVATGRLIGRTVTDASGRYAFPNVPAGTYQVIVGYPPPLQQMVITTPGGIQDRVPLLVVPGGK